MSDQVRIVHFDETLKKGFFDFEKIVHPKEQRLNERMQWFTFDNPVASPEVRLPGLAIVTAQGDVIGQFLMSPFEFQVHGNKHVGHFGYDFFVKEEYRSRGAGALLFVQGVRMYKPFVGVGLTYIVEKISKAAGIQTIGSLKKFIWMRNPVTLGSQLLKHHLFKSPSEEIKPGVPAVFPDAVDVSGMKFQRVLSAPQGFGASCSEKVLEPLRTQSFLQWRFWSCPWQYATYVGGDSSGPSWLVVREALYQGVRLLLIVDHRFPAGNNPSLESLLRAAKKISEEARLEGVVISSTYAPMEEVFKREGFLAAGKPSSVIAYLPSDEFTVPVKEVHLTMADSDLDFSFGDN